MNTLLLKGTLDCQAYYLGCLEGLERIIRNIEIDKQPRIIYYIKRETPDLFLLDAFQKKV